MIYRHEISLLLVAISAFNQNELVHARVSLHCAILPNPTLYAVHMYGMGRDKCCKSIALTLFSLSECEDCGPSIDLKDKRK